MQLGAGKKRVTLSHMATDVFSLNAGHFPSIILASLLGSLLRNLHSVGRALN